MHTAGDGAGSSNSWVQDLASLYPHDLGSVVKLPKRTPLGNRSPVKPNGRRGVCMESMSLRYRHLRRTAAFKMGAAYWSMRADSKSVNCGFESHHLCKARPYNLAGVDRANAVACDGKDCAHWP